MTLDAIVLGAGPAGAAAATEGAALGLHVAILDEQVAAGGQVHRTTPGLGARDGDGDALREALAASKSELHLAHRVWNIERDSEGFRLFALGPDGPVTLRARALVVATGAQERFIPFRGWDLPGVMGLASATILMKSQRLLPGRDVVVAGSGPLLYAVAHGIVEAGGRVAAIVDARPRSAWWQRDLLSRPDLLQRGASWMRALHRARVPIVRRATIERVERDDARLLARAGGRAIACDAVCCGFGLMPTTDVTRLLGARHAFHASLGGWHAVVDDDQRTDVPGLYVAGDAAGIRGAAAAPHQGRIAARSIAGAPAAGKEQRDRAARFGLAMTRVANVGEHAIAAIPRDVTVCLCERLTRAAIERAIDDGCATVNDVKGATRCGMGPCGGRMCEDTVARLVAARTGRTREEVGMATARPPLRPVELDAIAGDFDYEALPMPAPAPL
ncbi:MAG: NAD(P)/FAD-dependent oxidoreductase [Burkholderiales bacterium]